MTPGEIAEALVAWTPYLATGFGWNMVVSLAAMAIGTPVGLLLATCRNSQRPALQHGGGSLTTVAYGVPTFVMLFYLAYIIPEKVALFGLVVEVPAWQKASLALGIAVAGYVSDNALAALRHLRRDEFAEAMLFVPAWTSYFLIIVMASSTASVIGVPELVHRSETVIGAVDKQEIAFWVYLYAMCWFFAFGGVVTLIMRLLRAWLLRRGVDASEDTTLMSGERR